MLKSMGYIIGDANERRYRLTSRAYCFGIDLLNQLELSCWQRPILNSIAFAFRVTAHIAVFDRIDPDRLEHADQARARGACAQRHSHRREYAWRET
jgi:DNA-binding IclR family transcriptional regulator